MYKIKRFISLLIVLVMFITMLPMETLAREVELADTGAATASNPGVYLMGEDENSVSYVAVIWVTSAVGNGYIKYTFEGTEYTVYDMRNGIIRTNDTVHVVKVPRAHLEGATGGYTVYSDMVKQDYGVMGHYYATTKYSETINKGPYTLESYDGGQDDFDIATITDVHAAETWSKNVFNQLKTGNDPDLVVFSGDIVGNDIDDKADIETMFRIMGNTTVGKYPIVFARGNHETRGARSTMLLEYFPTETGEFYFDFRYGPLWGVVMDTCEDKPDNHSYYGKLANFTEYHYKQQAWLRQLEADADADYRIGVFHIPRLKDLDANPKSDINTNGPEINYQDSINHLGLQFGIAGHAHICSVYSDPNQPDGFTTFLCGSNEKDVATKITLDKTKKVARITAKNQYGATVTFNNYEISLGTNGVGTKPEPLPEVQRGASLYTQFDPTGVNTGDLIDIQPAVFETGGDWYNVVWTTNETVASNNTASGAILGSTGYVEYEYDGKKYQVFDEVSGYRRFYSNVHTVRVPKEHLNNNKYKVCSFTVTRAYDAHNPYFKAGIYDESQTYIFEDRSGDKAVNIVMCPDIRIDKNESTTNANNRINRFKATIDALGTSPAVVVINGDAVGAQLDREVDIANIVKAASMASGGAHPVVFSRGESECRGGRSADLMRYFPTATGELYYSVDIGEYTLVNLDTGEDAVDNAIADDGVNSKYNGRVQLDKVRQDQLNWINSMNNKKKIVVSHIPLKFAKKNLGVNFEAPLVEKNAVIALSGHEQTYSTFNNGEIFTIIGGGAYDRYNNVSVLVSDNYAHIETARYTDDNYSAIKGINRTVDLTTKENISCSADGESPSLSGNVYTVSKPDHLVWISKQCASGNTFTGYTFEMANDIDMRLIPFTPIGGNDNNGSDDNQNSKYFAGKFDGCGYSIKNLYIDFETTNNVGFFGVVRGGTIQNLTLDAGFVNAGKLNYNAPNNASRYGDYVGALAGYAKETNINNCYTDVVVRSKSGSKVGGILGYLRKNSNIDTCANYGNVGTYKSSNTGGIVGQTGDAGNKILNSYNRGNVIGQEGSIGGFIGYLPSAGITLKNSYNASAVTNITNNQGAFVGYNDYKGSNISDCYFASGFNGATSSTNVYKANVSGGSVPADMTGVSSKTNADMKTQDFLSLINKGLSQEVFAIEPNENDGYPIHKDGLVVGYADLVFKYIDRNGNEKTHTHNVKLSRDEIDGCALNGNKQMYPITKDCYAVMTKGTNVVFVYSAEEQSSYAALGYTQDNEGKGNRITYYAPEDDEIEVIDKTIAWTITDDTIEVSEGKAVLTAIQSDVEYTVTATVDGKTGTAKGKFNECIEDCLDRTEYAAIFNAPEKDSEGLSFSYWKDKDGTILSYSRDYLGYKITGNKDIIAVYGAEDVDEWLPVIEDVTITRETSDDSDCIYTDYLLSFNNKNGLSINDMKDTNVSYGLVLVRDANYFYKGTGTPKYPTGITEDMVKAVVNKNGNMQQFGADMTKYNCYFFNVSKNTAVNNYNRCRYYLGYDVGTHDVLKEYTYAAYAYVKVGDAVYVSQQPTNVDLYQ